MFRNFFLIFPIVSLLLFSTSSFGQQNNINQSTGKANKSAVVHRVVMQLSSGDSVVHKGLINNLRNLKAGWGDSVLVEVVVHGPGIDFVHKDRSTQQKAIQEMIDKGIEFVVCRNTMTQKNVPSDKLLPRIGIVPMGVGEIIMKQEQGWSYIKVGS